MNNIFVFEAANIASKSILKVMAAHPKPGLATPLDINALDGVNYNQKLDACMALIPCFINCVSIGIETAELKPEDAFTILKPALSTGEQGALLASKGAVRLRGEIFLLGLLCAAAGRLKSQKLNLTRMALTLTASSFVRGICERELFTIINEEDVKTPGQRAYLRFGIEGLRGEAEHGYSLSLRAAGLLSNIKDTHGHLNFRELAVHTLIYIIAENGGDTCIAAHNGIDRLIYSQNEARKILNNLSEFNLTSLEDVSKFDKNFRKFGISPRGSEIILESALCIMGLSGYEFN